ncbi:MAG: hypothetical protein KJ593_05985 [Candidatus Omnitrophica bacterium]|nr:hypothetical protein [Candidatus Omnitrophota bacterium]
MKQDTKDLKLFGLALTVATSVICIRLFLKNNIVGYYLILAISATLFTLAILRTAWLEPLSKVFKGSFHFIMSILTITVLTFLYYLVITPIGLFSRFLGKDFLQLKKSRQSSYWVKPEQISNREDYLRQF